jgi:hypothetical protein
VVLQVLQHVLTLAGGEVGESVADRRAIARHVVDLGHQ